MIADIFVILLIFVGIFFIAVAGFGIFKMPDAYTRMSVVTKAVTFGIGSIMLAIIVHFNDTVVMLKIIVLIAFLLFSLSIAAHVIGLSAYRDNNRLWPGTFRDEFKADYLKDLADEQKKREKKTKESAENSGELNQKD